MFLGTHGASAGQSDLLVQRAFWKDTSAQATLEQAQQQHYTPFVNGFSGGYTNAAHWLRLTLEAADTPTALRLSPTWIDEITLYDPASPKMTYRAGDRHPNGVSPKEVLGYAFILPASNASREIWLRVRSTNSHQLMLQALPVHQLALANTRTIAWTALYAAFLLLIMLALLSIWAVQREAVLSAYLVRHINYTLYGLTYLGLTEFLLSDLLPPGLLDQGFSLLVVLTLPLGLWFDITLLKTYNPHPLLQKMTKALAWASLILIGLLLAGHVRLALQLTIQSMVVAVPLVLATAWSTKPNPLVEQLMPKRVMLGYYALILSSLLIGLSSLMGWKALQEMTPYFLTFHGLVSGLVMTIILFVRGQRQYQMGKELSWKLKEAQQTAELEQRRRSDQSQFLHMLLHELKTPLAIVALALGTRGNREANLQHANSAVQDMKAIIDRCVKTDQLGQLTLQKQHNTVDLVAMLQGLIHSFAGLSSRLQLNPLVTPIFLQTDGQLLQIILSNLLDNANRYSDPFTPVIITLDSVEQVGLNGLSIRVSNTPGLAGWPDASQLFSKYYRSSGAKNTSGSGLGLFLAHQLAQTLGGTLQYKPCPQHVEFVLWIPMSPA